MATNRQGFSLAEVILVAVLLGIFAAVVVPRLNLAAVGEQKSLSLARRIQTDLRYTRQLALSRAGRNPEGYGLFMQGSAPYDAYLIRDLSNSRTVHTYAVDEAADCEGGQAFRFGPLGNLLAGSDTELTLSAGDRSWRITVIPATGVVECQEP